MPIERGKGVAVVASSEMVGQRSVDLENLVKAIWSAHIGAVFGAADDREANQVPAGLEVNTLERALSRCRVCVLLWDEEVRQDVIKDLKNYCETGGWVVFVSCPWTGRVPKSSPVELLRLREFGGIAHAGAVGVARGRRAVALLKHPSIPDLPVGERLRVYLQSSEALGGEEGEAIPLVRFEEPVLRGIAIQAMGHGGTIEANWDCPAGGRIGETESLEFIQTIISWLAEKESWKEPAEQPGILLKVIARTPTGEPAPGSQIAVKVYTDWAKDLSQQVVTVDDSGQVEIAAVAPAIYMAWASGEGYSSDTFALERVEEGILPEPLVVTVRPSLRIMGTVVYTGEAMWPAVGVQVDLLPSSRARAIDVVSTEADDEGRFGFEGVPGGRPYLLGCETEEWAALQEIDLPESAEGGTFEVTLSLEKLAAIDGRMVEEGNEQKPIEGATVRFERRWGIKALPLFSHHLAGQGASTGSEGEFRLLVLPDVTYRLKAAAPGYVWRERKTDTIERTRQGRVEVTSPATVTLELGKGTTLKGIVYFPAGQPASNAHITVSSWPPSIHSQNADPEGRFFFPCVLLQETARETGNGSAYMPRVAIIAVASLKTSRQNDKRSKLS